ncbi:hypothetical protein [Acinetobacter larvae]|uniref:Uncharacterized protein n=1 Tax=Acinetobacter larvae TaxID=1789224 RepID=A0A1B2M183_9GAMM|nr:hypothetical protein [Acinetobacter larvae]AOA58957.1 hypothetical protein BFG52_11755 [Acinetobacter larvae]
MLWQKKIKDISKDGRMIMALLLGMGPSTAALASNDHMPATTALRCDRDIPKFEQQFVKALDIIRHGTLEQVRNFGKKTSYEYLFRKTHPKQRYYQYRWTAATEAMKKTKHEFKKLQSYDYIHYHMNFAQPSANFILGHQEICLIKATRIRSMEEMASQREIDRKSMVIIFSRDLGTLRWRNMIYHHKMRAADFAEFYPNFPEDKKVLLD